MRDPLYETISFQQLQAIDHRILRRDPFLVIEDHPTIQATAMTIFDSSIIRNVKMGHHGAQTKDSTCLFIHTVITK